MLEGSLYVWRAVVTRGLSDFGEGVGWWKLGGWSASTRDESYLGDG